MRSDRRNDYGLETLLSLSGYVFYLESGGHWVKFEAHQVAPTKYIPHGISYSLTLHDRNNVRIVGYDNAHRCIPKLKKYRAKIVTWDHVHKRNKVSPFC